MKALGSTNTLTVKEAYQTLLLNFKCVCVCVCGALNFLITLNDLFGSIGQSGVICNKKGETR